MTEHPSLLVDPTESVPITCRDLTLGTDRAARTSGLINSLTTPAKDQAAMPLPHLTPILPLASESATLPLAGGKGANLARLAQAGLPVPAGFTITTQAYQASRPPTA